MKLGFSIYSSAVNSKTRGIKILNEKPSLMYILDAIIIACYLILLFSTISYWWNSCLSLFYPLIILVCVCAFVVLLLNLADSENAMKLRLITIIVLTVLLCSVTMVMSKKTACGMGICSEREKAQDRIDRVIGKVNKKQSQCNLMESGRHEERRDHDDEDDKNDDRDDDDDDDDEDNEDEIYDRNERRSVQKINGASTQNKDQENEPRSLSVKINSKLNQKRENDDEDEEDEEEKTYHTQEEKDDDEDSEDSEDEDDDLYDDDEYDSNSNNTFSSSAQAFFCQFYDSIYPPNTTSTTSTTTTTATSQCTRIIKSSIIFRNPELSLLRILIVLSVLLIILVLVDIFLRRKERNQEQEDQQDNRNDIPLVTLGQKEGQEGLLGQNQHEIYQQQEQQRGELADNNANDSVFQVNEGTDQQWSQQQQQHYNYNGNNNNNHFNY